MSDKKPANLQVKFKPTSIIVDISKPKIGITYEPKKIGITYDLEQVTIVPGAQIVRDTGDIPIYQEEYEVTPSQEEQILHTDGHLLTSDVRVNPIPSNYGLITWNGSVLTVS